MTTKDQDLRPPQNHAYIVANKVAAMFFWSRKEAERVSGHSLALGMDVSRIDFLDVPPKSTPDCRTCANLYPVVEIYGGYTTECDRRCTNGDNYVEAPEVVLWGTV